MMLVWFVDDGDMYFLPPFIVDSILVLGVTACVYLFSLRDSCYVMPTMEALPCSDGMAFFELMLI